MIPKDYKVLHNMFEDLNHHFECCKSCGQSLGYDYEDIAENALDAHDYWMRCATYSDEFQDITLYQYYKQIAAKYIDLFQNDEVYYKSKYFKGYKG